VHCAPKRAHSLATRTPRAPKIRCRPTNPLAGAAGILAPLYTGLEVASAELPDPLAPKKKTVCADSTGPLAWTTVLPPAFLSLVPLRRSPAF